MDWDLDSICDDFEERWKSGERPEIAEALDRVSDAERSELLRELIQIELWWRRHETPAPSEDEYQAHFPEDHSIVAEAFQSFRLRSIAEHGEPRTPESEATLLEPLAFDPAEQPTLLPGTDQNTPASGDRVKYFGEYELLDEIARGGMGVVFKARQVKLNRIVALKMILSGELAGEEEVQRFKTEAEAAANLDHPGIVPIYEIGEHEGQHYFSMGFVEGQSLADRVKDGPLPPKEAAEIVKKVAEAVAYAHEKGVIHRDLKPANVLLDANGEPRVTDFGLAKQVDSDSDLTSTGAVMGTPSYMPPEQAAGKTDEVGPQADVYSLGAILYCLLTGRPPFQSANPMDILLQVLDEEPVPSQTLNPAVPRDLDTICLKCLQKSEAHRYHTVMDLVDELARFLCDEPIVARPVGRPEKIWRWCRRNPLIASYVLIIAVLALTIMIAGPLMAINERALRSKADYEKGRADKNAANAQSEKGIALRERDAARRMLYSLQIASSQREYEANNAGAALSLLLACDPDLRGWEHDYLYTTITRARLLELTHPSYQVAEVAFSPIGPLVCSGGGQSVAMWNSQSGKQVWALNNRDLDLDSQTISCVAFSPNGSRIVIGYNEGLFGGKPSGALRAFDSSDGQQVDALSGGHDGVTCVAFSPSGDYVVSGSRYQTLKLWNAQSGELIWENEAHSAPITNVTFSPNGNLIGSASEDGKVSLWTTGDCTLKNTLEGHRGGALCVSFSSDGKQVVTGGGDHTGEGDYTIKVWNTSTGQLESMLQGHSTYITNVIFSGDGEHLISSSGDHTIKYWDCETGRCLRTFCDRDGTVDTIALSSDGSRLASGSEGDASIKLWDNRASQNPLVLAGKVVGESRDLARIVLETNDHEAVIWDAVSGRQVEQLNEHTSKIMDVALQRDGSYLACVSEGSNAEIWNLATGTTDVSLQELAEPVAMLRCNPEVSRLLTVAADGTNQVWNTTTGELMLSAQASAVGSLQLYSHKRWVGRLRFSSDGSRILGCVDGERLTIWDSASGKQLRAFSGRGGLKSVAWTPSMSHVVVVSDDGRKLEVNDTKSGRLRFEKSALDEPISLVVLSPGGNRVVGISFSDWNEKGHWRLWNVESGEELLLRTIPGGMFKGVVFSPDGSKLAGCGDGNVIETWHAHTGEAIHHLHGHSAEIQSVAFSPDGTRIASCASDDTVKIWDANTGNELLTLSVREPGGVRFSADGKRLACYAPGFPERTIVFDASQRSSR